MSTKRQRARGKAGRRQRAKRRDLKRRAALAVVCIGVPIVAVALMLTHRGSRPDTTLQRARIALSQGLTQQAVDLARDVLERQTDDPGALAILVEARLAEGDLVASRTYLSRLEAMRPDGSSTRRLLLRWALTSLDVELHKPTFTSDPAAQASFDDALSLAEHQADWFAAHPDDDWPEALVRAKVTGYRVRRLELLRDASSGSDKAELDAQIREGLAELERHLDRAIASRPDDPELLQHKAELFARTNRTDAALKLYRAVVERSPSMWQAWLGLARTAGLARRFPMAEAAYRQVIILRPDMRPIALVETARLSASQGLPVRAAEVYLSLIDEDMSRALPWSSEIGQTLYRCERFDEARAFLQHVPPQAPTYAAAQVTLARIEQAEGQAEAAGQRLNAVLSDRSRQAAVVRSVAGLNPLNAADRDILIRVDRAIDVPSLPPDDWARWLTVRVRLADLAGDWSRTFEALDMLRALRTDIGNLSAAQVALLVRLGRTDRAKEIGRTIDADRHGPLKHLVDTVLDGAASRAATSTQPARAPAALFRLTAALARCDEDAARASADALTGHPVLYRSDVRAWLADGPLSRAGAAGQTRRLALAVLARETGLHGLSANVAGTLVEQNASLLPAHAVLAMATLDLGRPIEPVLEQLADAAPQAALTHYLRAQAAVARREHPTAVKELRAVLAREPAHPHIAWVLAEALSQSGRRDEAVGLLQGLTRNGSQPPPIVLNALAYLLAEHDETKLDLAYRHAGLALRALPYDPAVLDTFGWIEHLRGQSDRAVRLLTMAASHTPVAAEVHYHLGMVYGRASHRDWARYHLRQALRQSRDGLIAERARQQLMAWEDTLDDRHNATAARNDALPVGEPKPGMNHPS